MIINSVGERFLSKENFDLLKKESKEEIVYIPYRKFSSNLDILSKAEVLISISGLDPKDLKMFPNLKWIQSFSAGVNTYPFKELKNRNIVLTNTSGIHGPQITDQIMGVMLNFSRHILESIGNKNKKDFNSNYNYEELKDKNLLIIGAGNIAKLLAKKAKAFDMRITGIKRNVTSIDYFDNIKSIEELEESLKEADYVVNVLPLTKDTYKIIGEKEFDAMKESAIFINYGRGKSVDEKALINALKFKKIKGAALDVFEKEPLPKESPLWEMDNVIITPHSGGFSFENELRAINEIKDNIVRYKKKEKLKNIINLELEY